MLRQRPSVREGRLDRLPDWPPQAAAPAQHGNDTGNGAEPAGLQAAHAANGPAATHASHSQPRGSPEGAAPAGCSSPTAAAQRSPCSSRRSEAGSSSGAGLHLEFRDVCFSYSRPHDPEGEAGSPAAVSAESAANAETPMQLQHVTFTVQPGEAVGIVGPPGAAPRGMIFSLQAALTCHGDEPWCICCLRPRICILKLAGCGKSTVLRLIMRLYDAQSGSVLLNGLDVREVDQFDCVYDVQNLESLLLLDGLQPDLGKH